MSDNSILCLSVYNQKYAKHVCRCKKKPHHRSVLLVVKSMHRPCRRKLYIYIFFEEAKFSFATNSRYYD